MKRCLLILAAAAFLPACHHNAALIRQAKEGDPLAQYEYGRRLLTGQKGVRHNPARAVAWLRAAASDGYAPAQSVLALCYERGIGVAANAGEAKRLYTLAAAQGHAPACQALIAQELHTGNTAGATGWLRSMAEGGNPAAQMLYGKSCLSGAFGKARMKDGVRFIRYAAMQGNEEACLLMADCYEKGEGVPKDAAMAEGWRKNAEELKI